MTTLTWFCIRTKSRSERVAKEALEEELSSSEVFLPIEPMIRGRGVKRFRHDVPLIPRYLFIGVPAGANLFRGMLATKGVERILTYVKNGPPGEVPENVICDLQALERKMIRIVETRLVQYRDGDAFDLIRRLECTPSEDRTSTLHGMLGRGMLAKMPLAELQRVVYHPRRTTADEIRAPYGDGGPSGH